MRLHKNQSGSAVIILLVILVLVIVGFGGYYVWHTQHTKTTVVSPSKSSTTNTATSTQKYLTIKEWGVTTTYTSTLNLEYDILAGSNAPAVASFSSTELDASGSNCKVDLTASAGYGGVIERYADTEHFLVGDEGTDSGKTAAQYAQTADPSDYAHVGNYYYFWQSPQAACSQSSNNQNLQDQTDSAVKSLLAHLAASN